VATTVGIHPSTVNEETTMNDKVELFDLGEIKEETHGPEGGTTKDPGLLTHTPGTGGD
jgi:hypothetical protein